MGVFEDENVVVGVAAIAVVTPAAKCTGCPAKIALVLLDPKGYMV